MGQNIPPLVVGVAWMVLAACLLGVLSVLVRTIAADLHPFEIAFFRNFFQVVLMLPWLVVAGVGAMRTQRVWAHMRRSVFGIFAMLTWFSVLTMMPIAQATAISFSAPLFTTAGAAFFLGEHVGVRRWTATVVGFLGVLLIIRPGFAHVGSAQLLALLAAVLIAGAILSNKSLAKSENPNAMVVWMGLFMGLFSIAPAVTVWHWPVGDTWAWLLALGVVATGAHLSINRALASGDASFIAPFGFVQIPLVALLGFTVYGEVPDAWTWTGVGVIFISGAYTAHREAKAVTRGTASSP